MPSSRIVLEIPELMLYVGKIMSYVWLELPFIVLVRESLIATKTHPVKTRLARKRSQNKEEFLYLMEWIKQGESPCSAGN